MLKYQMMIIEKVSFNRELFEKEIRKSMRMLTHNELEELRIWAFEMFSNRHNDILRRTFAGSRIIA